MDSVQYNWFSVKRAEGKPVTSPIIIEKAKKFKADLNVTDSDSHFSEGWLRNFKSRHGICRLDVTGETRSANEDSAKIYIETFKQIVSENDQSPHQVYNADETGILWRCLPTTTSAAGDEKTAKWFNKNKDRLTVILCANATGELHLSSGKRENKKKPRDFKHVTDLPVYYDAQQNAWMTANLFKVWFCHHFVLQVKDSFVKLKLPEDSKAVLLLDNCKAHPPVAELVSGNIFATLLPPNVTSLMVQGVIENFKRFIEVFLSKAS